MLRLKTLVVMCLGLVVSCGFSEPPGAVNPEATSRQGQSINAEDNRLEVNPPWLDFGEQRVGTTSASQRVTVSNTGTGTLQVSGIALSGPFTVSPGTPFMLEAGASLELSVTFSPTVEAAAAGTLTLSTNDMERPSVSVSLSGVGVRPHLAISSTVLDFGAQRVGSPSDALQLVISNTGSAELEVTEFTFSNSAFALASPPPMPLRLAPEMQQAIFVTFTPSTLGAVSGRLHIVSNAFDSAASVELKGQGADGQLLLTPNPVSFGGVEVGGIGVQQSVILSNVGGYPLTITSVTHPEAPPFSFSGLGAGLVLQPGESSSLTVTFAPTRRGHVTGTVTFATDSVSSPTTALSLSGTGLAADLALQPDLLDFKANLGESSTQNLDIRNLGERDLHVSGIEFADTDAGAAQDFSVGEGVTFPLVVQPGERTFVPLKFTPPGLGMRQAQAIVHSNVGAAEVTVHGEGTSPLLALSATALDFGNVLVGRAAPRPLTLTNTGSGPLTLTTMTLDGVDADAFFLTTPVLPFILLPGASTEVTVSMNPEAARLFSARLVVESNDPAVPNATVPLSGVGVLSHIQLSASELDFGRQLLGHASLPRTVRLVNHGDGLATLTAMSVQGAGSSRFSVSPLSLPLVLAPGQQAEVAVTFTPGAEDEESAALAFSFHELMAPLEVALRGQGTPTPLSINPAPLDFGAVRLGGARREEPLTLTNLLGDSIVLAAPEVRSSTGEAFTLDTAALEGRTLEPGQSVIITVGYQPRAETVSETTLSFGTLQPQLLRAGEVTLKGRGLRHLLSVEPKRLDFGQVQVGAAVPPKEFTVTNASTQPLRVVATLKALEGTPFAVQASALAEPLPPGESATLTVTFQPQTEGDAQNEVQVWLLGDTEPEALITVTGSAQDSREQPGGCSCGTTDAGSAGMLALLALVGLGSRRRRRA